MLRLIKFLILLIVIAAIIGTVYLWMARVPLLERYLSKWLNTQVTIEKIHLEANKLSIEGLRIANPDQSTLTYAFQGEVTAIEMSPFELLRKTVRLDRIALQNPVIGIELYNSSGTDNNWARILNGLPTGGGTRNFIVKKLTVTNLRFEVVRPNDNGLSVPPIPYLEFENLGTMSLSQLGRVIFQSLLHYLLDIGHLGAILENVRALPQNVRLPIKEGQDMFQEGADTIRRKSDEASEFLRDLYSSD